VLLTLPVGFGAVKERLTELFIGDAFSCA